ncbi:MAG: DAK2 domain-containing protein [Lachnospiraceae bacterium]|nr:DAK2 domain-containing protein [Candidatus Colinaster scatohippi]
MFLAGAKNLEAKKEWINELNVFPVPDGDTGTNMTMTIMSAAKEVVNLGDPVDMLTLAKVISSGSLRGARGNSGVILSQLLRGFTKVMKENDELDITLLAEACEKAVESAYKAVMKPKEGTILTVAKGMCDKAVSLKESGCDDLQVFLEEIIRQGDIVLEMTPDMLPVLKQAGVVDSGGQGLMQVVKGAYDAFMGKEIDYDIVQSTGNGPSDVNANNDIDTANIKFGYCTEFIIMLEKQFNVKHEMDFKAFLESIGDSIVLVADDEIVKVHVHTNDPGMAIQRALKYGALSNMKIDNMRLEHQEKIFKASEKAAAGVNDGTGLAEDVDVTIEACGDAKQESKGAQPVAPSAEKKEVGFIAVSVGEGMDEIFTSLGVDIIISGGQTMNPSTEDFVNAANNLNAENIFVFPNNKNIVMAANQAKFLVEDKNIVVIPTKTVPQGITAIINYVPDMSVEENENIMNTEILNVKTGEVTYAVRDTQIDDKVITQGDYMGIGDKGILSVGRDMDEVVVNMVDEMVDDDSELISIYFGADVAEDKANEICDLITEKYSDCDVELQFGGQPIYYYIISVE